MTDDELAAEHAAEEWVDKQLMPILRGEHDGGRVLMRAIVDAIFFEAALCDLNGGTNSVTALMTGAHRALDRANPWIMTDQRPARKWWRPWRKDVITLNHVARTRND
jgi:hypothetical protein